MPFVESALLLDLSDQISSTVGLVNGSSCTEHGRAEQFGQYQDIVQRFENECLSLYIYRKLLSATGWADILGYAGLVQGCQRNHQ